MGRLYLIAVLLFILPLAAHAEVVFSDDFEWGSDWNSSQGNTAPISNGWNGILCSNRGGSYEAAYVNTAGAKQGSRGFIQYWDQTEEQGSAQDIWLTTNSLNFPNEYYIGYWFKIDSNWDWGSASSLKIFKTAFADVSNTTWNVNWVHVFAAYCGDSWCNVDGTNWTGDSNCGASIMTDSSVSEMVACWNAIDDGQWHYFVWHMNHSGEVLSLEVDGTDVSQMNPSSSYGAPYTAGVDGSVRWNFGGNITDGGGGVAEMWTAYDDIIIATTKAEVNAFLGVGGSSSTPTCQGISVQGGIMR